MPNFAPGIAGAPAAGWTTRRTPARWRPSKPMFLAGPSVNGPIGYQTRLAKHRRAREQRVRPQAGRAGVLVVGEGARDEARAELEFERRRDDLGPFLLDDVAFAFHPDLLLFLLLGRRWRLALLRRPPRRQPRPSRLLDFAFGSGGGASPPSPPAASGALLVVLGRLGDDLLRLLRARRGLAALDRRRPASSRTSRPTSAMMWRGFAPAKLASPSSEPSLPS